MCGFENHTFRQITLPSDQEYLQLKGCKPCKSVTGVSKHVQVFARRILDYYQEVLRMEREKSQMFYVIVDEYGRQYTRQRYLGVTVLSPSNVFDLGLHRITDRATASRLETFFH